MYNRVIIKQNMEKKWYVCGLCELCFRTLIVGCIIPRNKYKYVFFAKVLDFAKPGDKAALVARARYG